MARRKRGAGQALVEFALVFPLFAVIFFGIIDLGRGIYMYNGVSQAAREIARSASVHPGSPLGSSSEAVAVIDLQRSLVPGIKAGTCVGSACTPVDRFGIGFHCEGLDGSTVPGDGSGGCAAPDVVRVVVTAEYAPVALLGFGGPLTLSSSSSNQVQ